MEEDLLNIRFWHDIGVLANIIQLLTTATSNAYSCAQDSQAEAETANPVVLDHHTLEHAVCNRHCCNHTKGPNDFYQDVCCQVYKTGETFDTCKVNYKI